MTVPLLIASIPSLPSATFHLGLLVRVSWRYLGPVSRPKSDHAFVSGSGTRSWRHHSPRLPVITELLFIDCFRQRSLSHCFVFLHGTACFPPLWTFPSTTTPWITVFSREFPDCHFLLGLSSTTEAPCVTPIKPLCFNSVHRCLSLGPHLTPANLTLWCSGSKTLEASSQSLPLPICSIFFYI